MRHRMLDHVVRREAGVGQRRCGDGVEILDRDEQPLGRDNEILGEPAVASEPPAVRPAFLDPFTDVLHALGASPARAAAPGAVDDHRVAFGHPGDARSDGGDVAGVLVAQREGRS